jgi:hypothetical protein
MVSCGQHNRFPAIMSAFGQIDDKGRRAVMFLNGPDNPIIGLPVVLWEMMDPYCSPTPFI